MANAANKPPWTRGERVLRVAAIVGIALIVIGGGMGTWRLLGSISSGAVRTPALVTRDLDSGRWVIYQRTGSQRGGAGFTFSTDGPPTMSPEDVRVTGPDGERVAVRTRFANETITINDSIYHSALTFTADRAGSYRIEFLVARGDVLVQRPLSSQFAGLVPWIVLGFLGFVLALATGIPLAVRRSRRRQPVITAVPWGLPPPPGFVPPPVAAVPGWHPDPSNAGRQRWWDGTAWTDHQS